MTPTQHPSVPMPRGIRAAAVLALLLSCLSGVSAATELGNLVDFSENKQASLEHAGKLPGPPEMNRRVVQAQFSALEPMRDSRMLLLAALAVSCAFSFVAAGRMLRPDGLPREGVRQLLGGAALASAVLRTLEGAQASVVLRGMGQAMADTLHLMPEPQLQAAELEPVRALLPSLALGLGVAQTALMAGAFALLGQYFRSQRVREAVLAHDGPRESDAD